MQLYDFLKDSNLNNLRNKMKAPLIDTSEMPYKPGIVYSDIFDVFDGKEVDFQELAVGEKGFLYHKGILISLNIKDVNQMSHEEKLPRLHISFCKTLQEMKSGGRFKRYITSCKDNSIRDIRFVSSNHRNGFKLVTSELDVCKFCLEKIRWNGYRSNMSMLDKDRLVKEFDLAEFYKKFEPQFYSDFQGVLYREKDTIDVNNYQLNWSFISHTYRKSKNWCCEICRKNCSQNKGNLHVHHINGIKLDNSLSNLKALCFDCHADQPFHGHMRK